MSDIVISIGKDFSEYPAGRTRRDGENSAQRFREDVLVPALRKAIAGGGRVVVKLDGVFAYSSSFLEEAFGGLARNHGFTSQQLRGSLLVTTDDPLYASVALDANQYLNEEIERVAA